MSSLVTSVPGAQCPDDPGPGAHAWVNAPTTTTSPLTTAVLHTVASVHWPPGPNHCGLQAGLPANTFGVHLAGDGDTTPGSWTPDGDTAAGPELVARPPTTAGPPVAADALPA